MSRFDPGRAAGRIARAVKETPWTQKAKDAAASLKAEYAAGKDGDESPVEPIWPTPRQQLDGLRDLFGIAPRGPQPNDAAELESALRGVDWLAVRMATTDRAGDAARAMRTMADDVDWSKAKPVAARVSSALIAAVASGRIGVGGPLGSVVARAISDQGLVERVAARFEQDEAPLPPDFRGAIEATSRDADDPT